MGEEDRVHVHASTAYTADDGASRSVRINLQTGEILHLPRRAVTEPGHVRWMRIRRYLRELYDQPKVTLSLKTRMVNTEAVEVLLYGCSEGPDTKRC